ncbi:MAG: hypothetical protein ACLGSH_06565 [Acidobacteriota bacterium]
MTRGLVRYQQTGDFHFLTFSCYHRLAYLASGKACVLFESALGRVRKRFRLAVGGYVTGLRGSVEIESFWTAAERGYELPEGFEMRNPAG